MRQTKTEAIPKVASLVGLRNTHWTFQTYIAINLAAGKRENDTFLFF